MKSVTELFVFYLFTAFSISFAQLPLQIKPKARGFPGKHHGKDIVDIAGRGVFEPMYRLNNTFIPFSYEIEVRVILDNDTTVGPQFTAPGKVKITGVNRERTSRIVLHAKDLAINQSSVTVTSTTNPELRIDISSFSEDSLRDFFIIELTSAIEAGEELEIYMEHVAQIIQGEVGIFYRTYETESGEIKRLAATQFQSVDARRMFPCFDEPFLKATFQLTVIRKANYTSLSNTEIISSVPDSKHEGWMVDKYAPTVKMSTYLVALVVSDFEYVESFFGNKSVRTYAPKQLIEAGGGNYSVDIAAKCLSFYEEYLNETYKLTKMYSVAIPEFSGAMENYGLNIYGKPYLLFYPEEQTEAERIHVITIIAHELAHQWFGNLVTIKWWSEMFLNEGLASYMQYLGAEAASPDVMGVEFAILDAVQFSMLFDANSIYTHPLTLNVTTPDEIEGMFSTISYEKGASVFRMMEGFLTRETLQKGLQAYLKKMAYTGAEQDDLFNLLQDVASADNRLPANMNVPTIMHTWTYQAGFPLVKVEIANETHVRFSQERFKNHDSTDSDGLWYIPISIYSEDKPHLENNIPEIWLESDGLPKVVAHNRSKWIMINNNATGFYRTLYDKPLAELIKAQLESNPNVIPPLSRSQLIDDYFVFSKQKYVNVQSALNFTTYLHKETHFTVWSTFLEHFTNFFVKFSSHPAYPLLQSYLQPKVDAALIKVGLEEDPTHKGAVATLRADLLDWSCSLGSPLCKEYAQKLLAQWQANPEISPISLLDARSTLQCAIVATGGRAGFDFIFSKYRESTDSEITEELLNALACSMDADILEELLNKTLNSDSGIKPADADAVLINVAKNPLGRSMILKFMSTHIDYIIEVLGHGQARPIGNVLNTLSAYFTTQSHLDQVQSFVDTNQDKLTTIVTIIRSTLGLIRSNISWMNSIGLDVWMWLWFQ